MIQQYNFNEYKKRSFIFKFPFLKPPNSGLSAVKSHFPTKKYTLTDGRQ